MFLKQDFTNYTLFLRISHPNVLLRFRVTSKLVTQFFTDADIPICFKSFISLTSLVANFEILHLNRAHLILINIVLAIEFDFTRKLTQIHEGNLNGLNCEITQIH